MKGQEDDERAIRIHKEFFLFDIYNNSSSGPFFFKCVKIVTWSSEKEKPQPFKVYHSFVSVLFYICAHCAYYSKGHKMKKASKVRRLLILSAYTRWRDSSSSWALGRLQVSAFSAELDDGQKRSLVTVWIKSQVQMERIGHALQRNSSSSRLFFLCFFFQKMFWHFWLAGPTSRVRFWLRDTLFDFFLEWDIFNIFCLPLELNVYCLFRCRLTWV